MLTAWRWDFSTIKECPNPRMLDLNRIRVSLQGGTGGDEEVCGDVVRVSKGFRAHQLGGADGGVSSTVNQARDDTST